VLDQSSIIAQAIEGHGGNITINAGEFIASSDSIVSASSQKGISGTIEIIGPRVDLNGALIVLSSELRNAAQVLRNSCAAQSGLPQSSLIEPDRAGSRRAAAGSRCEDSGALHRRPRHEPGLAHGSRPAAPDPDAADDSPSEHAVQLSAPLCLIRRSNAWTKSDQEIRNISSAGTAVPEPPHAWRHTWTR